MDDLNQLPYLPQTMAILIQQHSLGLAWIGADLRVRFATQNLADLLDLSGDLKGQLVSELAAELKESKNLLQELAVGERQRLVIELIERQAPTHPDYTSLTFYTLPLSTEADLILMVCERIHLSDLIRAFSLGTHSGMPSEWPAALLVDPLTGLNNRQALDHDLPNRALESAKASSDLTIAVIDLDNFQAVNETMGRPEGDRLLQVYAQALLFAFRRNDTSYRTGDDEFVVLLPATIADDFDGLYQRFDTIFEQVRQEGFPQAQASLGLAALTETNYDHEKALQLATQRMQLAKRGH